MTAITILNKDNIPTGPFTRAQIAEKLQSGEFNLESLAFVEGLAQWTPLRQVLAKVDAASPVQAPPPYGSAPAVAPSAPAYAYAATMSPPAHLAYAGFWIRFVAYLIDGLIICVPILIIAMVFGFIIGLGFGLTGALSHPNEASDSSNATGAVMGVGIVLMELFIWAGTLVISWLYFAKMESGPRQSTFGKRAMGLKVTNLAGERISFGQASGRFFAKIVSGMTLYIGFIMIGFTERKQGLHDLIAGTLVVKN